MTQKEMVWHSLCIFGINHRILWAVRLPNSDLPFHKFSDLRVRGYPIKPAMTVKEAICGACLASNKYVRISHQETHGGDKPGKADVRWLGCVWEVCQNRAPSTGLQMFTTSYSPDCHLLMGSISNGMSSPPSADIFGGKLAVPLQSPESLQGVGRTCRDSCDVSGLSAAWPPPWPSCVLGVVGGWKCGTMMFKQPVSF